ncbi:MAG TPA: rhamnulokinase family protein [Nocardioides sp.]|nr:rhamnulokinase family protein [Nocardioides sp.]
MTSIDVAAIDLGASSGRVVRGRVGPDTLEIATVARFPNGPVERSDGLHWDLPALLEHSLAGLAAAGPVAGIGVDAWAVDYGLLRDGRLVDLPWCYRDDRTAAGVEAVHARFGPDELYHRTGLQFLPFNTIYQLAAEPRLAEAERLLLVPDLVTWSLTGRAVCERTNASTTGLLDVHTRQWDTELLALVGLDPTQLGELVEPGTVVGSHDGTPVVAVGSHDTASAVVGVPMTEPDAAYVSCGTWGLVGVELDTPVVTEAARAANFTNEGGVDGRTRFLTNVMGTWLLSETLRTWATDDLASLLEQAAVYRGGVALFDVQDPRFLPPGDMPARIAELCRERQVPVPQDRAGMVRSIVASLAEGFATAVEHAAALSGRAVRRVHVVGGGAQNALLCRLLADRLGLPVLAGPVEATALGNVLMQGRALGALSGSLEDLRVLVARTHPPVVHQPTARGAVL